MAGTLTVIWWRDIPAQVVAKDGRRASKIVLHPRFQVAIDKAAVKAGKRAMDDYIAEWRKTQEPCGDDLEAVAERRGGPARGGVREARAGGARRGRWGRVARGRGVTRTIVSSASREVAIGFDEPFVIIGERINPTGRKLLAEEMKAATSAGSSATWSPRSRPAPTCSTSTPGSRWRTSRRSSPGRSSSSSR